MSYNEENDTDPSLSETTEKAEALKFLSESTKAPDHTKDETSHSRPTEILNLTNIEKQLPSAPVDKNSSQVGAVIITVGICLSGFLLVILLYFWWDQHVWAVIGDVIRNLAGLFAAIAAYIAWWTNKTRSHEAEKADFRDRMKWAVENSDNERELIAQYSGAIIHSYERKINENWISEEDGIFISQTVSRYDSLRRVRDSRKGVLESAIKLAESDLQIAIYKHGPLGSRLEHAQREAEIKKAAHELESPYTAVEQYVTAIHEIADKHAKAEGYSWEE